MFLAKLCWKIIENHLFESLFVLVLLLSLVYFANYFRRCYYVSKIPGPKAYPLIGNALMLMGSPIEISTRLYRLVDGKIPIIRLWFGPLPVLLIIHPQYVQEVLSNENSLEKPTLVRKIGGSLLGDGILISNVAKWKRNRSIVVRGFTPVLLKTYFKGFVEKSVQLIEILDKNHLNQGSFDIFHYITKTSVDSVCGSTMGVNVHAHERETEYFEAMESVMYLLVKRIYNPLKFLDTLYRFTSDYKQLMKSINVIQGLANKVITEKRNTNHKNMLNNNKPEIGGLHKNSLKKPLLDYLMDYSENVPEFTDEDLRDEINLIIMAGYETSAITISYILLNLAAHKDIDKKVCAELFSVLGPDRKRPIELDDLTKLEYMELVIKESLRLYPTIPLLSREPTEDIQIGKYIIPKGTACLVPIICLHRDASLWPDPLKFDPERFTTENSKNRHPFAYIPFSGGPRNCIGARYGMMFMKTILATLLSHYEFHTDLNLNKLKFQNEVLLRLTDGHQVRITPRHSSSCQ